MLNNRILSLIKTAMITKNQAEIRTYRQIKSELTLLEIEKGTTDLTREEELSVVRKMVEDRKNQIKLLQEEIGILNGFLPEEISKPSQKD